MISNLEEALSLADELLAAGCSGVVLKLGQLDGYTMAAGVTFNPVFAVPLPDGAPPLKTAQFASAAAAISVTRPGRAQFHCDA